MLVRTNKNGELEVVAKLILGESVMKDIIKRIVVNGYEVDVERVHERWTALYNAYDMVYEVDIRKEHLSNCDRRGKVRMTRISYISSVGQLEKLFYIATGLYKNEFSSIIDEYVNYGYKNFS